MIGNHTVAGLFLCAVLLQGAGLRYQTVCEVESAPKAAGVEQLIEQIQGEVLVGPRATLMRGPRRSTLHRVLDDGALETIELDHAAKTWKRVDFDQSVKTLSEAAGKMPGIKTKLTVREALPEREIDGYKSTGYGMDIGFEFGDFIREQAAGDESKRKLENYVTTMMKGTRFSVDTWVTQDVVNPMQKPKVAMRGVGAASSGIESLMKSFLEKAEGGAEALAKLSQVRDGFTMETILHVELPMLAMLDPENAKPMRIRVSSKNIQKVEIAEKEFAIPEGYRRVE